MTARPGAVDARAAARLTGLPVRAIHPLIGGRENTTQLIEIEGTGRVLLQQLRTRVGAPHRIRLAGAVPRGAARVGIPVPGLVAADPGSQPAWFIRRFIEGRSATATLRRPEQAGRMAAGAGRWCARWRTIHADDLRLYRLWTDVDRLQSMSRRWTDRAASHVDAQTIAVLERDIAGVPTLLTGRPWVLAHGDFTPANLLVDDHGVPIAVIDVEFARAADPLFDAAWFRAALILWAPQHGWRETWDRFWASYRRELHVLGVGDPAGERGTGARLDLLGRLRLLEIVEHTRDRPDSRLWHERLVRLAAAPPAAV